MPPIKRRETCDLSLYPDLHVILLGFKIRRLAALPSFLRIGTGLRQIRSDPPDGLLAHESMLFGWNHVGMRQYWRDGDSLARFTRTSPHAGWWSAFAKDRHGSGFWHETYSARGGMESVYVDMPERPGFGQFATIREPVGPLASARQRIAADAQARV